MSSCVMIASEFSNRIEVIFSYQTPVEVCTKKKQKKNSSKILVAKATAKQQVSLKILKY